MTSWLLSVTACKLFIHSSKYQAQSDQSDPVEVQHTHTNYSSHWSVVGDGLNILQQLGELMKYAKLSRAHNKILKGLPGLNTNIVTWWQVCITNPPDSLTNSGCPVYPPGCDCDINDPDSVCPNDYRLSYQLS